MTLPNFLLIGPGRSGTTSLYHWLNQHPEIYMSPVKEACFYAKPARPRPGKPRTREEYERLFNGITNEKMYGEACPAYLWTPTAADSIRADIPDARLIATLRNPADRAYSGWLKAVLEGRVRKGTAEDALKPGYHHYKIGFYAPHLRRYFDRFPRQNIKVVIFEDIVRDPQLLMTEIFEFLGVDSAFKVDPIPYNPSRAPRSMRAWTIYKSLVKIVRPMIPLSVRSHIKSGIASDRLLTAPPAVSSELRARLLEAYRDDILETSQLIGRDLSHWLKNP